MVHRWVSRENGEIKEFRSAVAIAKHYNCSMPTLYARLNKHNKNTKSPVFGKDILIFRLTGKYGDEIDIEELHHFECDKCSTPVRSKDIICDHCDQKAIEDAAVRDAIKRINRQNSDVNHSPKIKKAKVAKVAEAAPAPETEPNLFYGSEGKTVLEGILGEEKFREFINRMSRCRQPESPKLNLNF